VIGILLCTDTCRSWSWSWNFRSWLQDWNFIIC